MSFDHQGAAFEFLIDYFAALTYKRYKEFYTPQGISDILSNIVAHGCLDDIKRDKQSDLPEVLDITCGTGSLLMNVRKRMESHGIGKIYGQEKDLTIYNIARMNMLIHGMKDTNFEIFHGDSLINEWPLLQKSNSQKNLFFDAVVAHLPIISKWESQIC